MSISHQNQNSAPLLHQFIPRVKKGRALDFASGYGRNSFFMAKKGYSVDGFDRDQSAVDFCNNKARKEGLTFTAHCTDLEQTLPFSENAYELATVFYYLDRSIMPMLKKALVPGGILIYETFLIDQHLEFGHPSRKAFCWKHNELLRCVSDFRILYYHEGLVFPGAENDKTQTGTWVAQLVAERIS